MKHADKWMDVTSPKSIHFVQRTHKNKNTMGIFITQ
jgi:hypothetical protein